MPSTIIGLGEILWDLLPDGKQLGGAPANFAYHVKALGLDSVDSYIISSIGEDALGQQIAKQLDQFNIHKNYLHISPTYETGTVDVTLDKNGQPNYHITQNVAWDNIPEITDPFQGGIDIVCFGTLAQRSQISRNSINRFLSGSAKNAIKIFDINLRQSYFSLNVIEALLNHANIVKINDDELNTLVRLMKISGTEEHSLKTIAERYHIKLMVLTKGKSGSLLFKQGYFAFHPGYRIDSKDTIGAGDAFTAAIALGVLKGFDLDTMNERANQVASFVCTTSGAMPPLPTEIINLFH